MARIRYWFFTLDGLLPRIILCLIGRASGTLAGNHVADLITYVVSFCICIRRPPDRSFVKGNIHQRLMAQNALVGFAGDRLPRLIYGLL